MIRAPGPNSTTRADAKSLLAILEVVVKRALVLLAAIVLLALLLVPLPVSYTHLTLPTNREV